MIERNFEHKCDSCRHEVPTCKGHDQLWAGDRINPMQSIPNDTVLWCPEYEPRGEEGR